MRSREAPRGTPLQYVFDRVTEMLEAHGDLPTTDLISVLTPEVKRQFMSRILDTEVRDYVKDALHKMRAKKLIFTTGKKHIRNGTKVNQCLVVGLHATPSSIPTTHRETLDAMQRAARHYLETRQFDKMGLV